MGAVKNDEHDAWHSQPEGKEQHSLTLSLSRWEEKRGHREAVGEGRRSGWEGQRAQMHPSLPCRPVRKTRV